MNAKAQVFQYSIACYSTVTVNVASVYDVAASPDRRPFVFTQPQ